MFRGDSRATRHPVTDSKLLIIFKSLGLNIPDHIMFWAACNLAFFGFLCSGEFMVPTLASFSPDVHLSLKDIAFDSYEVPTMLHVRLKASKTDPFRKGCFIHISRGNSPLCAVQSLITYLHVQGKGAGPLFLFKVVDLYLGQLFLIGFVGFCLQLVRGDYCTHFDYCDSIAIVETPLQ